MYKMLFSFLILLAIMLTACVSQQPTQTSPLTASPKASATFKLTPEASPTNLILPMSSTRQPTITPTSTEEGLFLQCTQENSSLPKDIVPSNILVISTMGHGLSLLNFAKQTHREITDVIISAGTSPDGKWLVYNTTTNNGLQLVFESMEGENPIQIPKENSWSLVGNILWMDNQRIWFPEISTIQPATSVLVLNPFTGQKELFKTDYPGTTHYNFGSNPLGFHFGYSSAVYDPKWDYVVYPEFEQGNGYFQTLWDRKSQNAVVRVSSNGYYQNLPIWQESEKQFLLVGYPDTTVRLNEWLSVSLDGSIHQITNFGKFEKKYFIENNAALSPDGRTLAFSLSFMRADDSIESTHLILLDLESQKAVDTCLSANKIAWSLDGQYLAVSTPLVKDSKEEILLIDPKANQSYELMEGSQIKPIGWLLQP